MKKQFIAFAIIFALGSAPERVVAMAPEYGKVSGLKHATMQTLGSFYQASCGALAMPVHGVKAVSNVLYLPVTAIESLYSRAKTTSFVTGISLGAYLMYLISTCPTQGFTSHEHFPVIIQFIQSHWGKAAVGSLVVVMNALLANIKNKFVAAPVILTAVIGILCMWYTAPDGFMSHPFIQSILAGSINFASDAAEQIALFLEHCPEYAVTLKQFMCENFQTNCGSLVIKTPLEEAAQNLNCADVSQLIDKLSCTNLMQPSTCSQVSHLIQDLNCVDLMKPVVDSSGILSSLKFW